MKRRCSRPWAGAATAALLVLAAAAEAAPPDPPASPDDGGPKQTIVVTGTRLPAAAAASPIQTVDRRAFDLTAGETLEQTLNLFPQLIPTYTNTSNNPGTGAATLDLRGLGSFRTLVLVNGRRWIASDAGSIPEVDVNTIPSALVRRVEILTGGGSAVYGSDAVSGVINILLDQSFDGAAAEAKRSVTERGDGSVTSAALTVGRAVFGGRARIILSGGYLRRESVLQSARILSAFTLNAGCAFAGTRTRYGYSEPTPDQSGDCSGPGEEIALVRGGSNVVPGGSIGGTIFFPVGGGPQLLRNAGLRFEPDGTAVPFNFVNDAYNTNAENFLQVPLRRWSGQALLSAELGVATLYGEGAFIRTDAGQQFTPLPALIGTGVSAVDPVLLNLDNPFLPPETRRILDLNFGVDAAGNRGIVGRNSANPTINPAYMGDADGIVELTGRQLRRRFNELPLRQVLNRRDAWRALLGLRGPLGGSWRFDVYASASATRHRARVNPGMLGSRLQQAILDIRDPATGAIRCLDPSGGCVPANIFGAGNVDPAAAAFLEVPGGAETRVSEDIAEATASGPLLSLPGGAADLLLGAAARHNAYLFAPDPVLFDGDFVGFNPFGSPAAGAVDLQELFAETRLPLLSARHLARELTLEAGLRFSRYAHIADAWTWKLQGIWSPFAAVRLRGSYQRAVRAPNVVELFEAPSRLAFGGGGIDPCSVVSGIGGSPAITAACIRNGVPAEFAATFDQDPANAVLTTSGSRKLRPEIGRTFTVGMTLQASAAPALSASIDYYDIRIERAISQFGGGIFYVAYGCILGGGDPADPLCRAYRRDEDGTIVSMDLPRANIGAIGARGIDWQLHADLPLGLGSRRLRLGLTSAGTYYLASFIHPNAHFPRIQCAGFFGLDCGITLRGAVPRWKLLDEATLSSGSVHITLRHSFFSSTRDSLYSVAPTLGIQIAPGQIPAEAARLEARHYFDLLLAFPVGSRFEFRFGVNNLTDAKPALAGDDAVQANTDPSLYDVLGRRCFASLSIRLP